MKKPKVKVVKTTKLKKSKNPFKTVISFGAAEKITMPIDTKVYEPEVIIQEVIKTKHDGEDPSLAAKTIKKKSNSSKSQNPVEVSRELETLPLLLDKTLTLMTRIET